MNLRTAYTLLYGLTHTQADKRDLERANRDIEKKSRQLHETLVNEKQATVIAERRCIELEKRMDELNNSNADMSRDLEKSRTAEVQLRMEKQDFQRYI